MNTSNTTKFSASWHDFVTRSTTTIIVETSIFIVFSIISICGNLLVILTVCCTKSLRTVTNYFVVSLAFANFCIPTLALPLTLGWSIKGAQFEVSSSACDFQATLIVALVYLIVINMALMAVNRYVRVCHSQQYPSIFRRRNAIMLISAAWLLTFALSTAVLKASGLTFSGFVPSLMICLFRHKKGYLLAKILGNMAFIICVGVPLTIMFVCYFKVFRKIREHKRNVGPSSGGRGAGLGPTVKEVKITWTLFTVLLSYLLLWIPALTIQVVGNFIVGNLPRSAHLVVTYSVLCCSCTSPFIYGLMNNAFKNEYAKFFGRLICRKNTNPSR